jgi:hypothetical protein
MRSAIDAAEISFDIGFNLSPQPGAARMNVLGAL